MHRLVLLSALASVLGIAVAADGTVPTQAVPVQVEGKASDRATNPTLATDTQAQQAIDAATAAALIGALQTRFDDQQLELQLGSVHSERVSLRDIAFKGEAQIRFDGASAWLPVRFEALYDTSNQRVESPHITLGAELAVGESADALPLKALQTRVDRAMGDEFLSQDVDFVLGAARIVGGDGARTVVQAEGVAAFEGEERVPVLVRALYDQGNGRWIDAQYDFDVVAPPGRAVAAR